MTTSRAARRPGIGRDHPARARRLEAQRVAPLHAAAALDEQGRVAPDERARIGRRQRLGIVDAADRLLADIAARARRAPARSRNVGLTPNGLELLGLAMRELPPARAAIGLDPAAGAQQRRRRRRPERASDARRRRPNRSGAMTLPVASLSRLRRGLEIAQKRRRDRRQRAMADMGARIAVHRRPGDVARARAGTR